MCDDPSVYCMHVGDAAAASTLSEAEIDKRVKLYVDMEDPDIVIDLRELQRGKTSMFDIILGRMCKISTRGGRVGSR